MQKEILRMENIVTYSGNKELLNNANINLFEAEVVGIIGLNNSGKSVLIGGITGLLPYYQGRTFFLENKVQIQSMKQSRDLGIFYIQRKSSLINSFTVAENIYMTPIKNKIVINKKDIKKRTKDALNLLGILIDIDDLVGNLSEKNRLFVEICRAIVNDAKLIILDNVLDGLSESALLKLNEIFRLLKSIRISVILVDTRLRYLKPYCHRLFVMRDGSTVGVLNQEELIDNLVISLMIGSPVEDGDQLLNTEWKPNERILLSLKNVYLKHTLDNLSFDIYQNEILGIFNVDSSSGHAISEIIYGLTKIDKGEFLFKSKPICFKNTQDAIKTGIAFVPEQNHLFTNFSLEENILFASLQLKSNLLGKLNNSELKYTAGELISLFLKDYIKPYVPQPEIPINRLIQRKVAFSRAVATNPELIVCMNPAQTIDITSKTAVYEDILTLKKLGITVLVISSDIRELLSVCERILIVNQGKVRENVIVDDYTNGKLINKYGSYLRQA